MRPSSSAVNETRPTKKARLTPDSRERPLSIPNPAKTVDVISVGQAIENHKRGDDGNYNRLKAIFTTSPHAPDAPSPSCLAEQIRGLSRHVSHLDRPCSGLVHAVVTAQWMGRDEESMTLFLRFLGNLVSAQGMYVGLVTGMLVENFSSVPLSARRLPGYPKVCRAKYYTRTHVALRQILELVPSASSALPTILTANFPPSSDSTRAHSDYVRNLIQLTQYVPQLEAEVLALVTERLVKIDVQVQVDTEDLEEDDVEEGLLQEKLAQDSDDDSIDSDAESTASGVDEQTRRIQALKSSVVKMDAIMDLLFGFYAPAFEGSPMKMERTFDLLLQHFALIILPTYRSRHSQFLLFHFAQTSEAFTDKFAGTCFHLMCDKTRPVLLRQSSAAYLASFVARGAHISTQVVREVFQLLSVHLDQARMHQEISGRGSDLQRHGTFHAMVQALLYIFCFRWRDLVDDADEVDVSEVEELQWAPGVKEGLTRAIYSKFNPLRVCSPSIVNEFARIAHQLRFLYIYPLLETNRRQHLLRKMSTPSKATYDGVQGEGAVVVTPDGSLQLDAYFPFDPYHLPISKRWLKGDYVEWQEIAGFESRLGNGQFNDTDDET